MQIFEHIQETLAKLENDPAVMTRAAALTGLRQLGANDFSVVMWSMPLQAYPKLSSLLPRMAAAADQELWTGSSGERLLLQSMNYIRSVAENYTALTDHTIRDRKILDFGCGYGRFLRLGMYYTDQIQGCDPWTESVRVCEEAGLAGMCRLSEYVPESLPVDRDFELAIAFSVFTHLSERSTKAALSAIRAHLRDGAIACITIRPVEYWQANYLGSHGQAFVDKQQELHRRSGFAFTAHAGGHNDEDATYGDTSFTTEWLLANNSGWQIAAKDRSQDDPTQRYIFLRAA